MGSSGRGLLFRPLAVGLRPEEPDRAVDAALLVDVFFPPPPARALGFAGKDGTRARQASDRRVAGIEELVVRDLVLAHVVPDLVEGPVRDRVQLDDPAVLAVELHLGDVPPALPLLAPKSGDPRVEGRELPPQRLLLAD